MENVALCAADSSAQPRQEVPRWESQEIFAKRLLRTRAYRARREGSHRVPRKPPLQC